MSMTKSRSSRKRTGATFVILLIGFFGFLLAMTWERVTVRELNRRIEQLEVQLQSLNTDEAMLQVSIQRECGFMDVQRIANEKWGMTVADPRQRILVASNESDAELGSMMAGKPARATLATRVGQLIRPSTSWAASIGEKDAVQER